MNNKDNPKVAHGAYSCYKLLQKPDGDLTYRSATQR